MTKRLIVDVSRHLDSLRDSEGKKWDAPSVYGVTVEAHDVVSRLKREPQGFSPSGHNIWFYHSRTARTALGIGLIAEYAGIKKPLVKISDELNGMERVAEDEATIKKLTEGVTDRDEYESVVVAYSTDPTKLHSGTELPAQVGKRYQGHVHAVTTRHFNNLEDGETGRVFSMGHEPCLTMLVMQVTGKKYDETTFGGAARTAEAIKFTMEDTGSGVIQVKMEYRDMRAAYSIR